MSETRNRDYRSEVERMVKHLSEAERVLQSLAGGEVDAIVDPGSASPILLSRAQNAVMRSEARYRDLVDRCPALVCEMTPDGNTLFANEAVTTRLLSRLQATVSIRFLCPPRTASNWPVAASQRRAAFSG